MRGVRAPTGAELAAAATAVAGRLRPTPLVRAPALGDDVWLKLESLQPTGSFKVRGALAALSALEPGGALVTASAGNHALGVAWAATALGRPATVVVAETASPAKLAALERFDIEVVRHGTDYDAAEAEAIARAADGAVYVSAYNDPHVIAGQASIGAELDAQVDGPVTVVTPVGGGGLAAGLGLWAAGREGATVVGAEADRSPAFRSALAAGRLVPIEAQETLADGLAGNVEPGSVTFELVRDHVSGVVGTPEGEIEDAVRFMATAAGIVCEGASACAVAAVRSGRVTAEPGAALVVVVSGRNIAAARLAAVLGG